MTVLSCQSGQTGQIGGVAKNWQLQEAKNQFSTVVERHPFGGFKMSGGGTKAGGKEYLENFLFPRLIAENVLRRGFIPPEED